MERGYIILNKTLGVVLNIISQGFLKNADRVHVFFKKFGSLINSVKEKNSRENYNVQNVIMFSYKQGNSF